MSDDYRHPAYVEGLAAGEARAAEEPHFSWADADRAAKQAGYSAGTRKYARFVDGFADAYRKKGYL